MRFLGIGLVLCVLVGCGGPSAEEPSIGPRTTEAGDFKGWPKDTLTSPDFSGSVERVAESLPNDAETGRIPAYHMVPDWADPVSPIEYRTPKGAKITYHLLPREDELRAQDEARLGDLMKGKKEPNQTLVVARPWRGWYGSSEEKGQSVRVYNLFQKDLRLEIHLEWPVKNDDALTEGESVVGHLIFSVQKLKKG